VADARHRRRAVEKQVSDQTASMKAVNARMNKCLASLVTMSKKVRASITLSDLSRLRAARNMGSLAQDVLRSLAVFQGVAPAHADVKSATSFLTAETLHIMTSHERLLSVRVHRDAVLLLFLLSHPHCTSHLSRYPCHPSTPTPPLPGLTQARLLHLRSCVAWHRCYGNCTPAFNSRLTSAP